MGKAWKATMIGHHSHELSEEIGHSMALPMIVEALGPHGYMDMLLEGLLKNGRPSMPSWRAPRNS